MYKFDKNNIKSMTRRLNNFNNSFQFDSTIPNNMDLKRPGSRVSMSNDYLETRAASSLNPPKGFKNSEIFNYQTGHYEYSINHSKHINMTSRSQLRLRDSNMSII
jgi:hypothetical protein